MNIWLMAGLILAILAATAIWRIRASRTSPDHYQPRHKQPGSDA